MELFKDKTYDDLDDISQLVEPYVIDINEDLSKCENEIIIDENKLSGMVRSHGSLAKRKIIEWHANDNGLKALANYANRDYSFADKFFEFEIEEGTQYNAETNELKGSVKLIKKKFGYEDREIEDMMHNVVIKTFRKFPKPSKISKARLNEVCDLFGAKEALSARSANEKLRYLRVRYLELMQDKTLNIRDVALFKRFMRWNYLYIVNGNLPAMSNITKVKIMMRKELPIYSIKEEQV